MQRLTLQSARDERSSESLAQSSTLSQVEVAAARPGNVLQSLALGLVRSPVLVVREPASVVHATEHNQRTHLESSRETIRFADELSVLPIVSTKLVERNKEFRSHAIAPALH